MTFPNGSLCHSQHPQQLIIYETLNDLINVLILQTYGFLSCIIVVFALTCHNYYC
jgi:hypothetical protein